TVDLSAIAAAWRRVAERADAIVVEGAGGARGPLRGGPSMLDIPPPLPLPLLVVVGGGLGWRHPAVLPPAANAAPRRLLAGWAANRIDPAMGRADDNVSELARLLRAPLVADIGWGKHPRFDALALRDLGLSSALAAP